MSSLYDYNPSIHKLEYSIRIDKNTSFHKLLGDFRNRFGKERTVVVENDNVEGTQLRKFLNRSIIIVKPRRETYNWGKVMCFPSEINTDDLIYCLGINTGLHYASEDESENNYQNIPSLEAKFDIYIPDKEQDELQEIADYLATPLIPKIPLRSFYSSIDGVNMQSGNFINGDQTHYWFSPQHNDILTGYLPRRSKKASSCKIYVKKDIEKDIWFIRFESTLMIYQLKRLLGFSMDHKFNLPYELKDILYKVKRATFHDLYRFYHFNFDDFLEDLHKSVNFNIHNKHFTTKDYDKLIEFRDKKNGEKVATTNYYCKVMADRFNAKNIKNKMGKYRQEISEEELAEMLFKKFGIDLYNDITLIDV